ncbi:MAG: hypothetical protein H0T43_07200 [Solirubrobacterales bacterium]|nr:hypothetical protein [Solirubrobacterales bacterium]
MDLLLVLAVVVPGALGFAVGRAWTLAVVPAIIALLVGLVALIGVETRPGEGDGAALLAIGVLLYGVVALVATAVGAGLGALVRRGLLSNARHGPGAAGSTT